MVRRVIVEISRIILGTVFVLSGIAKGIDPMGLSIKIGEYLSALHLIPLEPYSLGLGMILCLVEFSLGAMLLMGIYRHWVVRFTWLLMLFMTLLTLWIALANPVADCGCFGDFIKLTNQQTLFKNIILFGLSFILVGSPKKISRILKKEEIWPMVGLMVFAFVFFTVKNYRHLPVKDFRPYPIGLNLQSAVDDARLKTEDEYKFEFIYSKNGKLKSFDMNNLPDDGWEFVERKETLVKKGESAAWVDFVLFNSKGEEVSEHILHHPKGAILVMAPFLEKANWSAAEKLNALYRQALEQGYIFYAVSASTYEGISQWRLQTKSIYPMLFMDATTIKTIVRGNPGLVLIHKGVIVDKLNRFDIPSVKQADKFINKELNQENAPFRHTWTAIPLGLWILLTLLAAIRRMRRTKKLSQFKEHRSH